MLFSTHNGCGPVWWGFIKLVMSFDYKGGRMALKGMKGPTHKVVEDRVATKELIRKKFGLLC